jgi:glycosyltransferase involved in cell wall biosynthesis
MKQTNAIKVLHLSYFGNQGGSGGAVSMRRLHDGMKRSGIDSKVLCIEGGGSDNDFVRLGISRCEKKIDHYLRKATLWFGITGLDGVRPSLIKKTDVYIDADIINIHRVLGVTSYLGFPQLTKDKPTVLTLCDTWAFTGRCYCILDCSRWQTGCGSCPHRNVLPVTRVDGSHIEWILKKWAYDRSRFTIVTKCDSVTNMLEYSVLKSFPVYKIPNGIDVQTYKPFDKETCRTALKLPGRKNILMFSAVDPNNYIKGADLLRKALELLPTSLKTQTLLLVMGGNTSKIENISGIETINLGYVESDNIKAIAYSAADLFLCPSRGEVLGNVNLESMACGTPVVAFRVGGIPDFVQPEITGYLAKPWDVQEYSRGILELLEDETLRKRMMENCRKVIADNFSLELQVDRYSKLYRQLLS